jgi:SAM-dependent methyltransferase
VEAATGPRPLTRQFNKLCDISDFADPELRSAMREIVGYEDDVLVNRKYWEYGMLGLYLRAQGLLRRDVDVLAVAAGSEPPLFWLTRHVGRVLATDIYGEGDWGEDVASAAMVSDPASFAPYEYERDRLEVRAMNALALDVADESFDVVYCLSSIEHFGDFKAIRASVREMARVVRPGGHLIITTECLVANHWRDWTAANLAVRLLSGGRRAPRATLYRRMIDALRPREIDRYVVSGSGLALVQAIDYTISQESLAAASQLVATPAGMRVSTATGHVEIGSELPHLMLRVDSSPWTSLFIGLRR